MESPSTTTLRTRKDSWLMCVCVCVCLTEDHVLRQRIGIPMGTNCAVFVANMFCFTYEYDFISRIIAAGRKDLISHFRHTLRFVDDLISVKNPVFEEYLYTSQTDASGIAGIYPPFLKLSCEQASLSEVSFLDVLLFKVNGAFSTKIYDKREHPPLSSVDQSKYPHPTCFLSYRSKFGIITSRLHCFARICLRKVDFIHRARIFLREFAQKGYSKRQISIFCSRFLKSVPLEFPVERRGSLVKKLLTGL